MRHHWSAPFTFATIKYMEVFEAIKKRYSCRSYKAELIPEDKLNKVLEAARLAPSAHNAQEWKFVVVKDPKKKEDVAEAAGQSFIAEASVVIAAAPGLLL